MPRGQFDRSARKAQTRERLLEAAAQVYARRGFNGATLEEVASEAGFTKGAVYAHFGSKENLLLALWRSTSPGRSPSSWSCSTASASPGSARWPAARAGWRACATQPDRFRLFVELWAQAQRDETLRARLAEALAQLRATFAGFAAASAADAGLESPAPVEQFANVMMALGLGLAMLELTDPGTCPRRCSAPRSQS